MGPWVQDGRLSTLWKDLWIAEESARRLGRTFVRELENGWSEDLLLERLWNVFGSAVVDGAVDGARYRESVGE